MKIEFTIVGKPATAGSKRAFRLKTGRVVVTDDCARSKPWRQEVASAAAAAMAKACALPFTGPLKVEIAFYLQRPVGHFGSGSNARSVKPSSPKYPTVKPDALKLARAVEDALTGVIYRDDSQIVDEHLYKRYVSESETSPGVRVIVTEIQ